MTTSFQVLYLLVDKTDKYWFYFIFILRTVKTLSSSGGFLVRKCRRTSLFLNQRASGCDLSKINNYAMMTWFKKLLRYSRPLSRVKWTLFNVSTEHILLRPSWGFKRDNFFDHTRSCDIFVFLGFPAYELKSPSMV